MITGVWGLIGGGKTLWTLQKILAERKTGRQVLANFHSRSGMWDYALWDDMREASNALVVIDEAQMWFGSRSWGKTQQTDLGIFQQSRKQGLDMIWIAQHYDRVDKALREVTAYYEHCQMLAGGRLCIVRKCTPDDLKKCLKRSFYKPHPGLFRHYWSEEIIGGKDGEGAGFGASTVLSGGDPSRSDGGAANRLWVGADGKLHAVPTLWVVKFPFRQQRVVNRLGDLPGVIGESCAAYWATWGVAKNPYEVLEAVYVDSLGRRHVVSAEGLLIGNCDAEAPLTWLQAALEDVAAKLDRVTVPSGAVDLQGVKKAGMSLAVAAGYRPVATHG